MPSRELHLTPSAAQRIRQQIARARGNEVCFLAEVSDDGAIHDPRVVARGHRTAVLAASKDAKAGMVLIHNHPSGDLDPSDPDLHIAHELNGEGIGFAITDNDARELYVVVEPARVTKLEKINTGEVEALLGPDGPIARAHPSYEDRPTQRDMAVEIARAYNHGGIVMAEAGTGTGKSIAYLVPAIRWSSLNRERTIVSTNTINLQEQLVGKDLPFLRKALGEPFRFALVKGRNNYISIRRAQLAIQAAPVLFDDGQSAELEAIAEWLKQTRDGSLQDLSFTPAPEVWDEVASESDVCLRAKCPHFEKCFYQRARRDAASADVLVVNHHLLFSDLAVRRAQGNYTAPAVLPPYRRVVLDEAHNLEDAATSHLGASASRRAIYRVLGRLERRGKGLLSSVEWKLYESRVEDMLKQDAMRVIQRELRPQVERAREAAAELFTLLDRFLVASGSDDGVLRIVPELVDSDEWQRGVEPPRQNLIVLLEQLARGIERLREVVMVDARWRDALAEQLVELNGATGRVQGLAEALRLCFTLEKDEIPMVRWLERRAAVGRTGNQGAPQGNVVVRAAPIDLSAALREALWDRVDTGVLTSATLATREGFEFLRGRLGLAGGGLRLSETVHPSPFDFEQQTLLAIPTDLMSPRGERDPRFDGVTARVVREVAEASDGGVFVLFTSYRSLRAVAADLRRAGIEGRWPLFVQGELPRSALVARFVESGRGVLLGVASFWEGVDVPGDPLRALVIPRLPFKVPTEPLTAARLEALRADGRNDFYEYMLPHAALRLKQGFGRLIRSTTDRGVVVLLDRRVLDKSYGGYFLKSLPGPATIVGPWAEVGEGVRGFYGAGNRQWNAPPLVAADSS